MITKKFKRAAAVFLASLMMLGAFASIVPLFVSAAEEGGIEYPITDYNPGEDCYEPIPMLLIMINFDADGDGVDDNANGTYEDYKKVQDPKESVYGEQWCHATEADWVTSLFSYEGNTLNTYYKYMSAGKFYWIPAKETYGEADNGVIAVTIKNVHPQCNGVSANWVHCFKQIVEAADEYVDFSVFDKDGNGRLEKYELCLAFVLGGAETSSGQTSWKEVFGFHAYYKDYDMNNAVTIDGVEVGRSGFFGTGAISGDGPLSFGVFAHELGHYLGAPDLYDTDGTKYDLAVGSPSMMASGSHGSAPSHFDPYTLANFGFCAPDTVREDGVYTLYSKASTEGEYNVLKVSTPNPGEYFLIENRFSSVKDGSTFDKGIAQGILIWHIDENLHDKTGMTCNSSGHGYDPAVVVYTPLKLETSTENAIAGYGAFVTDHPYNTYYSVFKPTGYVYPVSKTWYTSLTAEEAELVKNLKIEVISASGNEMQVKITGSYKLDELPDISMFAYDWTKTSVTIKGELERLNYATMTSATFTLTEKATGTVVKQQPLALASDYTYEILCEGLKPGTSYEYKIVAETSHGQLVVSDSNYTKPEEVKKATVTLVINSDNYKTTQQQVTVGSEFVIRVQLSKKGYTFGGWYLDEAYTQPYTPGVVESDEAFTIYAKWDQNAPAGTTRATKAPETEPATGTTSGTGAQTPGGGCGGESVAAGKNDMLMLCGGSVAAVLCAAAGKKLGKKKDSSDKTEE
ncbi:MAG: M6 family metalloprotease domain-containing protein [Clostridia bacterium]|nr:M6 family metalloprotease domain-containing protein [Clostridia bacterium]